MSIKNNSLNVMELAYNAKLLRAHGIFKEAEYPLLLAARAAKMDPAIHYLSVGEQKGVAPSRAFDPTYYVARYPVVGRAGVSPAMHFLFEGKNLSLRATSLAAEYDMPALSGNRPAGLVLATHAPSQSGQDRSVLAGFVRSLATEYDVVVAYALSTGTTREPEAAQAIVMAPGNLDGSLDRVELDHLARKLLSRYHPKFIVVHDLDAARLIVPLSQSGIPIFSTIQHFPDGAEAGSRAVFQHARASIFAGPEVSNRARTLFPMLTSKRTVKIHDHVVAADEELGSRIAERLREELKVAAEDLGHTSQPAGFQDLWQD